MNNLGSAFIEQYGSIGEGFERNDIKVRRDADCDPNLKDDEKPVFDRNVTYRVTITYPNGGTDSRKSPNLATIQDYIRQEFKNFPKNDIDKFFKSIDWHALS